MVEFKENQLLFGIETKQGEGILSFAYLPSLDEESPEIYFCRVNKSWIDDFVPGGLYRLEVKKGKLVQYIKEREFLITQPYYLMLLENKHALLREQGRFIPRQYYTFNDWKALMNFNPGGLHKIGTTLIKTIMFTLSSILPCLFYLFILFKIFQSGDLSAKAPILIVSLIPFMFWVVIALLTLCDQLLLKWTYTRYKILRDFTIMKGGMRREIGLPYKKRKNILVAGIVTFIIALIAVVIYAVL